MPFVDIFGAIVSDTTYVNNVLAAKDVEATLLEVAPVAAEVQAMGTMSLPIWQLIENMELAITKIGVDKGLRSMITPETQSLEMRFVQNVTDANGITKQKGCKAFFKCVPTKIPGITVTVGEASSNERVRSSAASDVYKRQVPCGPSGWHCAGGWNGLHQNHEQPVVKKIIALWDFPWGFFQACK